ncbi:MAG: hypothetical protein ACI902_000328 [Psychroserpens sp.]|jgi:hypothetical protein
MRYVTLITFLDLVVSLCSGSILEQFIIVITSIHRDYLPSDYTMNNNIILSITLSIIFYIFKFEVLFSALVFVNWAIFKNKKLE